MINNENKQTSFNGVGSNLLYLMAGAGIGATVALLFAPKPGKELRQDASEAVKHGIETANKTVSSLKETADDYYQKAQDKASELYRAAFKAANDGTQEAKAFAEKTVEQAQEMIKEGSPAQSEQIPPLFDSGKPFDQRNIKNGIL